jgi:hypothetical protein
MHPRISVMYYSKIPSIILIIVCLFNMKDVLERRVTKWKFFSKLGFLFHTEYVQMMIHTDSYIPYILDIIRIMCQQHKDKELKKWSCSCPKHYTVMAYRGMEAKRHRF